MTIPKIIHQIWSGIDEPLPKHFAVLCETWKRDYPDWEYILWDNKTMNDFINEHYPQYVERYNSFPHNVQRWDAIRYLILDKIGGMYVDCDYESIEPMDEQLAGKTCCFSAEPDLHRKVYNRPNDEVFNNAMMLSIPGHFFILKIIEAVFGDVNLLEFPDDKFHTVLSTTGPGLLVELYYRLTPAERESIYLIPAKYVTPFDYNQAQRFLHGEMSNELESCIQEAYAVHYYFGNWVSNGD